ncbi:MAG: alpha/beta hydrolase fold domain-containing protein [Bacteroidota bacterium]|nr:alpha/beta hydrolase fold domain-containing protein [Bacteroidota bacterium]MDP4227883.1 alpha/beta hydrolase fold domain-containing protein [Bacteroidota bacterium]MDP4274277.1 alpha/beta hydrolase fold domain-containing protein [Bacteroidota bacterium]
MKIRIEMLKIYVFGLILAIILLILFTPALFAQEQNSLKESQKRFSIMGLDDSITEGDERFQGYLFPLWQKLFTAGYHFDFVGPNLSKCQIGTLNHSGFNGKNAEYLDAHIDSIYRKYPADIVLLHAGHNPFDTENPIAGIIKAQESIIRKILKINPDAKILVAKVITSGKLPKYSYIPELNKNIAKMIKRLKISNVFLVDQVKGFDWAKFTISDKVHLNSSGAEKMAEAWFETLSKILGPADQAFRPQIVSYKQLESSNLNLHIFEPKNRKKAELRPAIIYFFGGGWSNGTPLQFYRECSHYAAKGMVAVAAEYRISYLHKTTPFESFEDAKEAIRWLRQNAGKYHIDPNRIAAAGASAGGQLAAATGIIKENLNGKTMVSSKPNLLLLFYPVIDNSPDGYGPKEMKKRFREISPLHNIDSAAPPTLFILGTKDQLIPVKTAEEFKRRMENSGLDCELHLFEGAGHPIFYYAKELTENYYKMLELSDSFLRKYGYLKD